MRDEQLTTTDFVATGERRQRDEAREIPVSDGGAPGETTASSGGGGAQMVKEPAATPLFPDHELQEFRTRWDQIQIAFVDEPREAVQDADSLVASTMKRLAEIFSDERKKMESQWDRGDDVSTEDLRVALQRYRSFFNRLLKM
jgi:hypothetical protein